MQNNLQGMITSRRFFIGWLMSPVPVMLGVKSLERSSNAGYKRLGENFLIVDGWILPSAYFK